MLKPQVPAKPSIELLAQAPNMDNNNLEKLVKSFVVEDKARVAASKSKAMPSSIQYALQKFERNCQTSSNGIQQNSVHSKISMFQNDTSDSKYTASDNFQVIIKYTFYINDFMFYFDNILNFLFLNSSVQYM